LLREVHPFWDDLYALWRDSPEPQTPNQREGFLRVLDGALKYWSDVAAGMDEADFRLHQIVKGDD
jgi:hypothetical protein